MIEVILFFLLFGLGLWYFRQRKGKFEKSRQELFTMQSLSEKELYDWLPIHSFEILNQYDNSNLSEMVSGVYQGTEFVMFLLSWNSADSQCIRQTVVAIALPEPVSPFVMQDNDVWVESNGHKLMVFKERQSMTCGSPMRLFLERIERWKKRVYQLQLAGGELIGDKKG